MAWMLVFVIFILLLYLELRLRMIAASAHYSGPAPTPGEPTSSALTSQQRQDQALATIVAAGASQPTTTAWLAAVNAASGNAAAAAESSEELWDLQARTTSRPPPPPPPQLSDPREQPMGNFDRQRFAGLIQKAASTLPAWEMAVERLMASALQQHETVRRLAEPASSLVSAAETVSDEDEQALGRMHATALAFMQQAIEGMSLAENARKLSMASYAAAEVVRNYARSFASKDGSKES